MHIGVIKFDKDHKLRVLGKKWGGREWITESTYKPERWVEDDTVEVMREINRQEDAWAVSTEFIDQLEASDAPYQLFRDNHAEIIAYYDSYFEACHTPGWARLTTEHRKGWFDHFPDQVGMYWVCRADRKEPPRIMRAFQGANGVIRVCEGELIGKAEWLTRFMLWTPAELPQSPYNLGD